MSPSLRRDAERLAEYVAALPDFTWRKRRSAVYGHMGATLADTALQAGVKYQTVVQPRIQRILRRWPLVARTTSGLVQLIEADGADVVLKWRHHEKPRRLTALARLFQTVGAENEAGVAGWMGTKGSRDRLLALKGIGPKTVDYLAILVGRPAIAVDRHIRSFVQRANVARDSYAEVQTVVRLASDVLSVDHGTLDASIWSFMSSRQAA